MPRVACNWDNAVVVSTADPRKFLQVCSAPPDLVMHQPTFYRKRWSTVVLVRLPGSGKSTLCGRLAGFDRYPLGSGKRWQRFRREETARAAADLGKDSGRCLDGNCGNRRLCRVRRRGRTAPTIECPGGLASHLVRDHAGALREPLRLEASCCPSR